MPAVLLSERESRGVQLVGIDPARRHLVLCRSEHCWGKSKGTADGRIVLGQELARQLQTSVGRKVVVLAQGADGKNRERGFRIARAV